MKRFLLVCLTAVFALTFGELWAQDRTITGRVTSAEDGGPLPGVNVLLKGTASGTATDADGKYSLVVPSSGGTLVFTFIGLESKEVEIGAQSVIDVQMSPDVKQLTEVVVTGVGIREKSTYAGSIAAVGSDLIQNRPVANVEQILQGNVPGLQLSAVSGTPGSTQNIRIRGRSSITASNEPLYVIDGVPVISGEMNVSTSTGDLSVLASLNPNDIESISVLKDATATAIYGARGTNGVILITTKKGKAGKPTISFSAQGGVVSRAVEGPKMLNSAQRNELRNEAIVNAGLATTPEQAETLAENSGLPMWDGVTDTNWGDVLTNDDAKTQSYDVSIRGGSDKANYYTSLAYFQQDGVNVGSDFERYTAKFNANFTLSDKLTLQTSNMGSYTVQDGQLEGAGYFGNPDLGKMFLSPWDKPYNDDGTINIFNLSTSLHNPLWVAANDVNRKEHTRFTNNTSLTYQIANNLSFTSTLGLDYLVIDELYYDNRVHGDGTDVDDFLNDGASYMYTTRNFNWVWKNMLDYTLQLDAMNEVSIKAIYEAQRNRLRNIGTGGIAIGGDGLKYPSSVATPDYAAGYLNDWAINSIMAVANYGYQEKIFLDLTLRGEGSSRFAPGNRWGTFYSVGATWLLSKESFLSGISWLNLAKIRASYGKTGNAGIDLNGYQPLLNFGGTYGGSGAALPTQLGNKALSWEKSNSLNVGLDFEIFDRVTGTVEYYKRNNYDLLLQVPITRTSGFTTILQNVGEMVNNGIEASLNVEILNTESFRWSIGGNITTVNNEVTKLPRDEAGNELSIVGSTTIVREGDAAYTWYMRTWAGVNPDTGAPLWYVNGRDGETTSSYNQAAMVTQGASALPTLFGSVNTSLDFKGIYLNATLYHSSGNKVYDTWAQYTQSDGRFTYTYNGYARQYDRWKKPGDISPNPKNVWNNTSNSNANSTRRLYDGSFMRLRDVTIGYNLPKSLVSQLKLTNLGVYVRGNNLWTKTKDKNLEFDPEVKADGYLDLNAPPLKSITLGIKVDF